MSGERGKDRSVQPIRPAEVAGAKIQSFPDSVVEAFNELIAQNAEGGSARVLLDDVVALMVEKGLSREEIFKKGWLNVEDLYQKAGWDVTYDRPGFNESYQANFFFEPSRKRK